MILRPHLKARIPPPAPGWFALAHAVLADGMLARLESSFDVAGAIRAHTRRVMEERVNLPWPPYPADVRERFAVFDGSTLTTEPDFALVEPFPKFDRMSDGNWMLAGARTSYDKPNASIVGPDGIIHGTCQLGDGIEHLQCDGVGGVWAAYFDEGIHGRGGDGEDGALSAHGLTRFDLQGKRLFSYDGWMDDCYTLNVADDAAWTCPYSEWPILKTAFDGTTTTWPNVIKHGATVLAVDGDLVVLLGGYNADARNGTLLRLKDGGVDRLGDFTLGIEAEGPGRLDLAVGRGATMNFVQDGAWSQLTVRDVADALL